MSRPTKAELRELESRPCRRCGAPAGQHCQTASGWGAEEPHAERKNDADRAAGRTEWPPRIEGMRLARRPPDDPAPR